MSKSINIFIASNHLNELMKRELFNVVGVTTL